MNANELEDRIFNTLDSLVAELETNREPLGTPMSSPTPRTRARPPKPSPPVRRPQPPGPTGASRRIIVGAAAGSRPRQEDTKMAKLWILGLALFPLALVGCKHGPAYFGMYKMVTSGDVRATTQGTKAAASNNQTLTPEQRSRLAKGFDQALDLALTINPDGTWTETASWMETPTRGTSYAPI